jgi:hypothetical protein
MDAGTDLPISTVSYNLVNRGLYLRSLAKYLSNQKKYISNKFVQQQEKCALCSVNVHLNPYSLRYN